MTNDFDSMFQEASQDQMPDFNQGATTDNTGQKGQWIPSSAGWFHDDLEDSSPDADENSLQRDADDLAAHSVPNNTDSPFAVPSGNSPLATANTSQPLLSGGQTTAVTDTSGAQQLGPKLKAFNFSSATPPDWTKPLLQIPGSQEEYDGAFKVGRTSPSSPSSNANYMPHGADTPVPASAWQQPILSGGHAPEASIPRQIPEKQPQAPAPDAPNEDQKAIIQWVIDQTRLRGYPAIADDIQKRMDNGMFHIKGLGSGVAGQVLPLNPHVMELDPAYIDKSQFFANTIIHEYVHARQFGTIGSNLVSQAGRAMSWGQSLGDNIWNWFAGKPWNSDDENGYESHFYGNDWTERMARKLADKVFPPDWDPKKSGLNNSRP